MWLILPSYGCMAIGGLEGRGGLPGGVDRAEPDAPPEAINGCILRRQHPIHPAVPPGSICIPQQHARLAPQRVQVRCDLHPQKFVNACMRKILPGSNM